MNSSFLLNPQGAWDVATQYTIAFTPGAAAIGLGYTALPLVKDAGSLFYASGGTQPTVGQHPAQQPSIWTLLNAGTVIKATAPTAADDAGDGYAVGTLWLNTVNGNTFICTDNTATTAVWTALAGNA